MEQVEKIILRHFFYGISGANASFPRYGRHLVARPIAIVFQWSCNMGPDCGEGYEELWVKVSRNNLIEINVT